MRMPVVFVGHGSPMNAIEDNNYTKGWKELGERIPRPKAIVSISAHWQTRGTRVNDSKNPKQIYDFYGFPSELYEVVYDVKGSEELAKRVVNILGESVIVDNSWGIDHGSWSVLSRIFPKADIPVVQVSLNYDMTPSDHFELGKRLSGLRNEGYLVFGSGNIVHNLGIIDWNQSGGFSWAEEFDTMINKHILAGDYDSLMELGHGGSLAVPTREHYLPLIVCLGATLDNDKVEIFNEGCVLGSISMTSYIFK
ncbi:MAG: Aromatic ring-cleaving dioxygenase [Fusobacteria bacterium]|nr:MAG: Aromatic ring-cleaving dioxygenase [Fusobacteriota bacterium]KAF0229273.1 MAG: Aromatic ring-cleaving [Fusobacteriota bacterium]